MSRPSNGAAGPTRLAVYTPERSRLAAFRPPLPSDDEPPRAPSPPSASRRPAPRTDPRPSRLAAFRPTSPSDDEPTSPPPAPRGPASTDPRPSERVRPPAFVRSTPGDGPDAYDPGPRVLTYIGFRQAGSTSRVFVRLDGRARFRPLPSPAEDTFVLELARTSINVENNARPLDTTYFPGPVRLVQAHRMGTSVHIEVRLRAPARWRVKRLGTTIAIDFEAE